MKQARPKTTDDSFWILSSCAVGGTRLANVYELVVQKSIPKWRSLIRRTQCESYINGAPRIHRKHLTLGSDVIEATVAKNLL